MLVGFKRVWDVEIWRGELGFLLLYLYGPTDIRLSVYDNKVNSDLQKSIEVPLFSIK